MRKPLANHAVLWLNNYMTYVNPITAYVTQLGYVACPVCAEDRDDLDVPMDSGNAAIEGAACDFCAAAIVFDPRWRVAACERYTATTAR